MIRILQFSAIGGLAVALATAASLIPFVWPRTDAVHRADAVIVLSGDHGERLPLAMGLMERGVAPTLVFDGTPDRPLEDEWCAGQPPQRFEVVCLRPDPDNTRAEARAAAVLAKERGWRRIAIVTSTHHVTRSRLRFDRCFQGTVDVVGGRPSYGRAWQARQIAREWLGVAQALILERAC